MTNIRKAERNDFDAIHQFICELENETFDFDKQKEIFVQNIQQPNNIYLLAVENNSVVGFVSCHIQDLLHHGGPIAEIQEMFVAKEMRSTGIGKDLINALKQIVKERNVIQLEVTSNNNRSLTHKFYERENFKSTHKKFVLNLSANSRE